MKKHYIGGKGGDGVYHFIINHMPKHEVYIETHLGGGSIFLNKKEAAKNILIEIDEKVINDFLHIPHAKAYALVNEDCMRYLNQYRFKGNELLFVDPPYLMNTRKTADRKRYANEYTTIQHVELLNFLMSVDCFVMLTAYESELYNEILHDWKKFKFKAMTRGGQVEETLYCNFNPYDYQLHDYSYTGINGTERMRIKRKSSRLIEKLKNTPKREREFLLEQIKKEFPPQA